MRISLTVETAEQSADVLVDCDDQTTAADLADALSGAVGASGAELVVGEDPATPSARVAELGLLDGHRVGLGHKVEPPPGVETRGWQLHVVSGPDAGAVFALPVGDHDVGRSGVVSFLDHAMSRRHCRITVSTNGATITDLGSSNGTRLDGALLEAQRPHPVELGQMIGIGHSVVTLRPARATDAVIEAAEPGHAHFLRQPRMLPPRTTLEVKVPAAPGDKPRRRIPMVAMLIPLAMGVLMAWLMSSPTYLLFALMSPAMMIGNLVSDMRGGAKDHRARVEKYHRDLEASQQQLAAAVHTEQNRLRSELPDAADTFLTCVLPGRRLWERRPYDVDALTLRVGTADLPSTVQLVGGTFDTQVDQSEHRLHCVPVAVDLKRAGVIGVAGPHDTVVSTLRWLTVQLCAFHPTRDLAVTVLTSRAEDHWRWVRWLPHLRPGTAEGSTAYVGNDPDSVSAQVSALIGLLTARKQAMQGGHGVKADSFPAHVLVVHGYRQVRTTLGLAQLLDEGPSVGIYAICADEDERLLPERCTSTIVADPTRPDFGTLRRTGESDVVDVLLEGVAAPWCERVARSLAPLVDVGADQAETMLPDSARLLEVVGFDPPQAGAIRARWALEPRSTAMTIGVGLDGPFTLDLRRDGPHGLIAGTTGSGKTELLQTMIASLALVNRPDELNFVLVDYKGDSAFKDCVNLPHTVGKVNDLDPHLVERALESLSAELRYREHFFAEAQVKDIEDYQLLQSKEPHRPSLPRLLLVIDEFAALFKELPDFVSGLVGIAQRGRSLGIHLLLATQRPSGVVSPEIRANTNLRVSLRVTDAADSVDILESPDAASIAKSSPGRGFARLGAGNLLSFQSGRVGGRRPGAVLDEVPPPFVAAVPWKALGYQQPQPPAAVARDDVKDTDLASLVEAVRAAAVEDGVPAQRQPWLPALPEKLTMAEVYDDLPAATLAVPPLPFGRSDLPQLQEQQPATFDLVRDGHLLVIGSARSGRSQLLRTLAGAIARLTSPRDVHLYGIDCGNGALNPFTSLPHCGAVVGRTEPERAGRLLGRIGAEMDRRQMLLAQHGFADIEEQRRSPESSLPHLVVMIDRWEGFTTSLADIDNGAMADMVTRILREGASLGVHLVISGDRTLAGNRIASMTEHKFAMRLADKGDFSLIGLSPRSLPDRMPPGRGFTPAGIEGQVLLLDEDESGQAQAAALVRLGEAAHARGELAEVADPAQRPFRLDVLPSRITLEEALALRPADAAPTLLPLAVGGDELTAMGPDLATSPSFLVAGPHRSGRSTTLLAAVHAAVSFGVQVVVAAPRPSPLRDLAGTAGVLQVFTDDEPEATYRELVASVPGPVLLVLDDAEELKDARAEDYFAEIVRGNAEGQVALLFGGAADALQLGFSGWHVEARKARRGLLLSPQESGDGDLVGLRLPRSAVGQPVQPGRGLLHLGDGQLVRVATVLP